MSLIDLSHQILTLDGQPLDPPLTMAAACSTALLKPPERPRGYGENVQRFDLALRIYRDAQVELSTEERALIKTALTESFGPLVVGQIEPVLEGRGAPIVAS